MPHNARNAGIPRARIMHAEDNPTVAACVRGFLTARGYHVENAANGRQALAAILAQPRAYDLIIMDYSMPELDGLECVKALRQRGFVGGILVFAGFLPDGVRHEFLGLGVHRILCKSADLAPLHRAIQDLLNAVSQNENKITNRKTTAAADAAD